MNRILKYFDLNERALKAENEEQFEIVKAIESSDYCKEHLLIPEEIITSTQDKENIKQKIEALAEEMQISAKHKETITVIDQLIMYVGILIGVIFSSVLFQYKETNIVDFSHLSIPLFLISFVIAFLIAPQTFEKLSVNPNGPFIVRFGLFIQQGIFWQVFLDALSFAVI